MYSLHPNRHFTVYHLLAAAWSFPHRLRIINCIAFPSPPFVWNDTCFLCKQCSGMASAFLLYRAGWLPRLRCSCAGAAALCFIRFVFLRLCCVTGQHTAADDAYLCSSHPGMCATATSVVPFINRTQTPLSKFVCPFDRSRFLVCYLSYVLFRHLTRPSVFHVRALSSLIPQSSIKPCTPAMWRLRCSSGCCVPLLYFLHQGCCTPGHACDVPDHHLALDRIDLEIPYSCRAWWTG